MAKKLTYEEVYTRFKEQNCELLDKEYKNSRTKLKYKCSCGNISFILLVDFMNGRRCNNCRIDRITSTKRKISYNYFKNNFNLIKKYFKDNGCTLLEKEYFGYKQKLNYQCSCGNYSQTTFPMFKSGHRCKKCGKIKAGNSLRYSYEYIKEYFNKNNCELLETSYKDSNKKLKYRCMCGTISYISFSHFSRGSRCKTCQIKKMKENLKHSYDYVKTFFKKENCELLSTYYENSNQKLLYRCSCGNVSTINFSSFKKGNRCKKCKSSVGEKLIINFLENNNVEYIHNKTFEGCKNIRSLWFDFYLPKQNMCIEYDGQFHFEPKFIDKETIISKTYEEQQKRDKIKNIFCKTNNIQLLRIPYWERENIDDILLKEIFI